MNSKYPDIESFRKEFFIKFPDSNLILLELLTNNKIKLKTKFGICIVYINNLYKGKIPGIMSSINKNEYFINQAKDVHGNKYNYDRVNYYNSITKINIICKKHGEFTQSPNNHLAGYGCIKCGGNCKSDTNEFILKANIVHKNKFDYSLVNYIKANINIQIICNSHGIFEQTPNNHLNSKICCPLCENQKIKERLLENPTGWNYHLWEKSGTNSKNFDSFKVYIIKCWNEEERFYKIGKTYRKVKERFHNNKEMPYKYNNIKEISGTALEISNLEVALKNDNKKYKYLPKISFEGEHECYKQLNNYEKFFNKK